MSAGRPRQSRKRPRVEPVPGPATAAPPGSIGEIDSMTGRQFERRLERLFRQLGYTVQHTGSLDDFGADLVVEKEGARTVV
jgi:HJR/Mrr/RecB family endonuclease